MSLTSNVSRARFKRWLQSSHLFSTTGTLLTCKVATWPSIWLHWSWVTMATAHPLRVQSNFLGKLLLCPANTFSDVASLRTGCLCKKLWNVCRWFLLRGSSHRNTVYHVKLQSLAENCTALWQLHIVLDACLSLLGLSSGWYSVWNIWLLYAAAAG